MDKSTLPMAPCPVCGEPLKTMVCGKCGNRLLFADEVPANELANRKKYILIAVFEGRMVYSRPVEVVNG